MADPTEIRSPRTVVEPMCFTRGEFLRGAIAAWVWFLVLHQLALLIPLVGYGVFALWATIPWSLGAVLICSPLAYALGYGLRKRPKVAWHLVAFTVFGLAIGAAAAGVALWLPAWGIPGAGFGDMSGYAVLVAVSAGPAVALGWWYTARRALAADRGERDGRRSRVDQDAAFEDSI